MNWTLILLLLSSLAIVADLIFPHPLEQTKLNYMEIAGLIGIMPVLISQLRKKKETKPQLQIIKKEELSEEVIIVTDPQLHILSANNAIEKIVPVSKSELLNKELFEVLFLKDENGKLVNKETFFDNEDKTLQVKNNGRTLTLATSVAGQKIKLVAQPMRHPDGSVNQIAFQIDPLDPGNSLDISSIEESLGRTRVKYEALLQEIKNQIGVSNPQILKMKLTQLEKLERDSYIAQLLEQKKIKGNEKIDAAKLCRHIAKQENEFAEWFYAPVDFKMLNFGMEDIAPLTVKNYPVSPEELTGPFFTIESEAKYLEVLIEKLLDIAVLLSSSQSSSSISLDIERKGKEAIIINITANCSSLTEDEVQMLFKPYYGDLYTKTNLHLGSGFEGFLARSISEALGIQMSTKCEGDSLTFTLEMPRFQPPTDTKS